MLTACTRTQLILCRTMPSSFHRLRFCISGRFYSEELLVHLREILAGPDEAQIRTLHLTAPRASLQIRFHDLRHACITKLAESQASEHTLMAIAGHVSRKMIEHYSHIRMEAKRAALDAIAAQPSQAVFEADVNQNVNQLPASDLRASAKSLI